MIQLRRICTNKMSLCKLSSRNPIIFNGKRCYGVGITTETEETLPNDWKAAKPFDSIPGPNPLPLIGNSWRFIGKIDLLRIMKQMHENYGEIVTVRKFMNLGDVTMLFNTRDIEMLFRNEGPWPHRDIVESIYIYRHVLRKDLFGDTVGLISSQNEKWGTMRSTVNPIMMQPRTTHQYIPQLNEIADEFIANARKFKSKSKNNEMPETFSDEINKWAFESITALALDTRLGVLSENPSERAMKAIKYLNENFDLMFQLDYMPTGKYHIKWNTAVWKRFVRNQDYFTELCIELIDVIQEKMKNDPSYSQKQQHEMSMFERLIAKDKRIAMVMTLDMLGGGVDTTGRITAAAFYYLAKFSQSQASLRKELKRFLPNKDTPITKEILQEAKYLRASIKEALRLAPIVVTNMRRTTTPMVLAGYQIPQGSVMFTPNLYLSREIDTYFSNPKEYIPERWLRDVKSEQVNPFVSLPFGFGARSCIGKRMAMTEIEIIVAKMVRNFVLEWPHKDMKFKQKMLYGIGDPLKIKLIEVID